MESLPVFGMEGRGHHWYVKANGRPTAGRFAVGGEVPHDDIPVLRRCQDEARVVRPAEGDENSQ